MDWTPSKTVLAVVLALALVVPTGAVLTGGFGASQTYRENGVVLAPTDGPNGGYADVHDDGTVTLNLSGVGGNQTGINADSETRLRNVFVVENRGDTPRTVWLSHDTAPSVSLRADGRVPTANATRTLAPGERIVVGVVIDTTGATTEPGTTLLSFVRLHVGDGAESDEKSSTTTLVEPSATETETMTTAGAAASETVPTTVVTETTSTDTTTPSPTATPTTTATPAATGTARSTETPATPSETPGSTTGTPSGDDGVSVTDGNGSTVNATVVPITTSNITDTDNDTTPEPRAVVRGNKTVKSIRSNVSGDLRGAQSFTVVGETVELDGTRSIIDTTRTVDREERIVKVVDLRVPETSPNETRTIRMRVSLAALGDTDPADARIGHHTGTGWQLLDTRVAERDGDSVVLQTTTDEFSPFAVFRNPEVTYRWQFPDGTVQEGARVDYAFSEPGLYNASLTVVNSFGQSDTATYRILVNDVPEVQIELESNASRNATAGETVTLVANISDEVGSVSPERIVWQLPDGTTARGHTVNYTLIEDAETVRVAVTDEYGSVGSARTRLDGSTEGEDGPSSLADSLSVFQFGFAPTTLGGILLAVGVVLLVGIVRSRAVDISGWIGRLVGSESHPPRVETLGRPEIDPDRGLFKIDCLRVIDDGEDVTRVVVTVADEETTVFEKTVETEGSRVYEAIPERITGAELDAVSSKRYTVSVRAEDEAGDETVATRSGRFVWEATDAPGETVDDGTARDEEW